MKKTLIFMILLLLAFNINPDKPIKGQWDLNPQKIWQVDGAGDDVFSRVEIAATDDGKGKITYVNLKTGDKKMIREFSLPNARSVNTKIKLIGLTPMIILGYDDKNNKLYYGMNDIYKIHVTQLNGLVLNTFSVKRP